MHLTNYSLNKLSNTFVAEEESENVLDPNNCSKRTLTALWKQIEAKEKDKNVVDKIKESIKETCTATLAIFNNMIMMDAFGFEKNKTYKGHVYQIFGFDILVD